MLQAPDGDNACKPLVDASILIVNWNTRELLHRCLASLEKEGGLRIETIVVDNASTDGSVEMIRTSFPNICIVANNENKGFAAANNQAAYRAKGRYILLLNPDTEVPVGSISTLIAFADNNDRVGVVGPRLTNPDGSSQRSCWRGYPGIGAAMVDALYLWKIPWLPLVNRSEFSAQELNEIRDVDHLLGACMLIRRSAWDMIGPLNEKFFLFLEETDWCRRAKDRGWRIVFYPYVSIVHYGQHSMRQQPVHNLPHLYRSYCHFYRESPNSTEIGVITLKLIIVLAILIRYGLWSVRGLLLSGSGRRQAKMMMKGYHQVLCELPSM